MAKPENSGGARTARDPVTGLTAVETEFITRWIQGGRRDGAGIYRAMYPNANDLTAKTQANRLLNRPEVVAYLARLDDEVRERLIDTSLIDKKWIEQRLAKIVAIAMKAEPVYDKNGMPTGQYAAYNLNAAARCLQMLGMERGMYVNRTEQGKPGEFKELDRMTDEEVRRDILETGAKLGMVIKFPGKKTGTK